MTLASLLHQAQRLADRLDCRLPLPRFAAFGPHTAHRRGDVGTFWQYRPYLPGDPANRIDWRKSARSQHLLIRENHHPACQRLYGFSQTHPSMHWHSESATIDKHTFGLLLLLALTGISLKHHTVASLQGGTVSGGKTLAAWAGFGGWNQADVANNAWKPAPTNRFVLIAGDGLTDTRLPCGPGVFLHIIDPEEATFGYSGHTTFQADSDPAHTMTLPRAEDSRAGYLRAFTDHSTALRDRCTAGGLTYHACQTDTDPEQVLTAILHRQYS